jgi:LysM repeat protein
MSLRLPKGQGEAIVAAVNALPERDKQKAQRAAKAVHTATANQTLKDIAKKYTVSAELVAVRNGLREDAVVAKGSRLVIPPAQAKTSLLPEARSMPLPPMVVNAPDVLLADAAELLPDAVSPPRKKASLSGEMVVTSALKGTVSVGRVRSELLEAPSLPAVDVIAGNIELALPEVDAVAGFLPRAVVVDVVPTAPELPGTAGNS